jgi:hypothetical protein
MAIEFAKPRASVSVFVDAIWVTIKLQKHIQSKYEEEPAVRAMALRALKRFAPPAPRSRIEAFKGIPDERQLEFWDGEVKVIADSEEEKFREEWVTEVEASLLGDGYEVEILRLDDDDDENGDDE